MIESTDGLTAEAVDDLMLTVLFEHQAAELQHLADRWRANGDGDLADQMQLLASRLNRCADQHLKPSATTTSTEAPA